MRKGICLLVVFMTGFLWSTASQAQDDDTILFDLGYVEDDIYYNDFLEFEFKIPSNWDYKLDTDQKILIHKHRHQDKNIDEKGLKEGIWRKFSAKDQISVLSSYRDFQKT
jgi:hypothetical protein